MGLTTGRRKLVWVFTLTLSLFIGYSAFEGRGFIQLHRMKVQRDDLRARVRLLEEQNARLAEEIRLLSDDPETLEALARIELGLVKPGETVYILPEDPGGKP
jgi:cell division protein FtsB